MDNEEAEAIYRLRYAAYLKEGALPPGAPEVFRDTYDDASNGFTLGLYVDGALSSSIRMHVATRQNPVMPAMQAFSDILQPMLDSGLKILDPTRFVIGGKASRLYPRLNYVTVRAAWLAYFHYDADICLATVRTEHQPFYKRLFGHRLLCEARSYPGLAKPISLMICNFQDVREKVQQRYPFMRSDAAERRTLFE